MAFIPYPFVRLVFFFSIGIVLYLYYPTLIVPELFLSALALLFCLTSIVLILNRKLKKTILNPGMIALTATTLAGYALTFYQTESNHSFHFKHQLEVADYYRLVIQEAPREGKKSWKTKATITAIKNNTEWIETSGLTLLYLPYNEFQRPPRYGDVLIVNKRPQLIPAPANPGEFDYKKFLSFQQIYYQYFLRNEDVLPAGNEPPNIIIQFSIQLRDWAEGILKQYVVGKQEQSVAIALVLGITDELDSEVLNAYSASGAMHVLAVSGLHIGILYAILLTIGKPLQKSKRGRAILGIVSLLLLWLYACITGLTPSVLRAVAMFSFVALAKLIHRNSNIYNTLAATAFCLLLYNPYFLVSVGFQLSFIAVLGIVYIHPRLYPVLEFKSLIIHKIWEITSVSIAAQLATFALGLLYFHQFPNYFLISNLVVIPVSFVVLVGGIMLLASSILSPLAQLIGLLLTGTIKLLNLIVFWVESWPMSIISNVYITTTQFWLITGIIIFLIATVTLKKFEYAILALICAIGFSALQWQHHVQQITRTQFMVYNVRGHTAIDFISEGKTFSWIDSALATDANAIRFHIRPHRIMSNANTVYPVTQLPCRETPYGVMLLFGNQNFLIRNTENLAVPPGGFPVDYVIFAHQKEKHFREIQSAIPQALCIFDSSNSIGFVNRTTNSQTIEDLIYSVPHEGAYQQNL